MSTNRGIAKFKVFLNYEYYSTVKKELRIFLYNVIERSLRCIAE